MIIKKIKNFKNTIFYFIISSIAAILLYISGIIGGVNDLLGIISYSEDSKLQIDSFYMPRTYKFVNEISGKAIIIISQEVRIKNNTSSSFILSGDEKVEIKPTGVLSSKEIKRIKLKATSFKLGFPKSLCIDSLKICSISKFIN